MIINKIKFPIYMTCIILSFILACIFIYKYLKNRKIKKKDILIYVSMIIPFGLLGSLIVCYIINKSWGLTSYVGCLVLLVTSIFYEKINPSKNLDYIKCTVLSMPLIYGVSKLGCFFVGCCHGIPYDGFMSVTYPDGYNIPLFPIQLVEAIVFVALFIGLLFINKKHTKNIISITFIVCAFTKFALDFLRFDHLDNMITTNQIISLALIVVIIVIMIVKNYIKKDVKK